MTTSCGNLVIEFQFVFIFFSIYYNLLSAVDLIVVLNWRYYRITGSRNSNQKMSSGRIASCRAETKATRDDYFPHENHFEK